MLFRSFWSRSSVKLSGIDLGGGPSLSLPGVTEWEARRDVVRDRPTREIRGDSGWKLDMIDNDNSPARHVWGFVATSRTWGDNAAKAGLAQNEQPDRPGASRQDQRSGDAAIAIGSVMDLVGDDSFYFLEAMMRNAFYDPTATTDRTPAPVRAEDRSVWWAALNPF